MTTEEVKAARRQWYTDLEAEKARYKKACEDLERRAVELKKACPHEDVYCYSGSNYDSGGYMCETCGKDLGFNKPSKCRIIC
jgi:hypothetical protein